MRKNKVGLTDWMPLLRDLRQYRRAWLARDLVAGLSVAAVQVPTAIAMRR